MGGGVFVGKGFGEDWEGDAWKEAREGASGKMPPTHSGERHERHERHERRAMEGRRPACARTDGRRRLDGEPQRVAHAPHARDALVRLRQVEEAEEEVAAGWGGVQRRGEWVGERVSGGRRRPHEATCDL